MNDKTTLTLEIARVWKNSGCNTTFKEYTSIDDDAADLLATCDGADLELDGLGALSPAAVRALSKQQNGSLSLSGLTSLSEAAAEAFAKYPGAALGFDGLKSLSEPVSIALAKFSGSLYLSGLPSVTDPVAEALSKHQGLLVLDGLTSLTHPGLADKLAAESDELNLSGLTELSHPAATALSKTKASRVILGVLKSQPNFDLAWRLFTQDGDSNYLSSLTSLSEADAATLSNYAGDLYLGLTKLTEDVAKELAKHRGKLFLNSLSSLSDIAAKALSMHKGTLTLPPALSTRVWAHWLRRHTGGVPLASETASADGKMRAIELQQGKLYDCILDSDCGREDCSVVQLAIDATTNRRFMLLGARYLYAQYPDRVHTLINMTFADLDPEVTDATAGGPDKERYGAIFEFILDESGVLHDKSEDGYLSDFKETDVI
jgi:hypothetical protein